MSFDEATLGLNAEGRRRPHGMRAASLRVGPVAKLLGAFLDQVGIDSHGRYVTFQTAEVAVSRQMFAEILF